MNYPTKLLLITLLLGLTGPPVFAEESKKIDMRKLVIDKPQSITVKKSNYQINIKILPDKHQVKDLHGAVTKFHINAQTPNYTYSGGNSPRIIKLQGQVVWDVSLQTNYGKGYYPQTYSGYGRGTTESDREAGNVRLAFHEHCHRQDYLQFVKERGLSDLGLKAGMLLANYKELAGADNLNKVIDRLSQKMNVFSIERTDNVGNPTKEQFLKQQSKE